MNEFQGIQQYFSDIPKFHGHVCSWTIEASRCWSSMHRTPKHSPPLLTYLSKCLLNSQPKRLQVHALKLSWHGSLPQNSINIFAFHNYLPAGTRTESHQVRDRLTYPLWTLRSDHVLREAKQYANFTIILQYNLGFEHRTCTTTVGYGHQEQNSKYSDVCYVVWEPHN